MSESTPTSAAPESVSGVELMRGVGTRRAKPFWPDAWDRTVARLGAQLGLAWIGIVAVLAILAPLIASGLPLWSKELTPAGSVMRSWSPLWAHLTAIDLLLLVGGICGPIFVFAMRVRTRAFRLGLLCAAAVQAGATAVLVRGAAAWCQATDAPSWARESQLESWFPWAAGGVLATVAAAACLLMPTFSRVRQRALFAAVVAAVTILPCAARWTETVPVYDRYIEAEAAGTMRNTWTLIPWSPDQGRTDTYLVAPGKRVGDVSHDELGPAGERTFMLGSDAVGQDVLSQMIHACRLSLSIGFVSTGISILIGVTLGAIMGYFGGTVDMLLYRVVEIFMAIPVLFLLIVASAVLPRNTYVMMAIIGLFSWTSAARFIRAEFMKLRGQDFVQAARAVGLPLSSVLFRHMLPNGVTPVLVQASFAIAAAILAEATLSFLGLGPIGQASWGKLLSSATGQTGTFVWWLAVFPGAAIFLTVLAYNLLGEAMRDAIDPKLRKAAH